MFYEACFGWPSFGLSVDLLVSAAPKCFFFHCFSFRVKISGHFLVVRKPNWLTTNQRPENPSFLETTNFASVLVRFSRLPSRKSAPRSLSGHRVTMPFGWRWRRDADPTPAPPSGDLNRLDAPAMARFALLWNDYGAVCLAPDPVGINRSSERAATNKGLSIIWGRPLPPLLSGLWSLGQRIPYPSRFRRPVLVLFFFLPSTFSLRSVIKSRLTRPGFSPESVRSC